MRLRCPVDFGGATGHVGGVGHARGTMVERTDWRLRAGAAPLPVRVLRRGRSHNLDLASAGVAFYALLALFPGLAALVALFGAFGDVAILRRQLAGLRRFTPPDVLTTVDSQLSSLTELGGGTLALSAAGALLVSVWSAHRGVHGFLVAMNSLEASCSRRGIGRQLLTSLAFTAAAMAVGALTVAALTLAPAMPLILPLDGLAAMLPSVRWPIIFLGAALFAAGLYRYGPNRPPPPHRTVWAGAALGAATWLAASWVMNQAVRRYFDFSQTYGSLAGVVVLLLWLYVSAYIFLIGAELNFELEATRRAKAEAPGAPPANER